MYKFWKNQYPDFNTTESLAANNLISHIKSEQASEKNISFCAYDLTIEIHKNVYPSGSFSTLLIEHLRSTNKFYQKKVLDIGTGCGYLALAAAKLGASTVVATDLSPFAIQNTLYNAKKNNLAIDLRQGGGTSVIKENEKFDLILAGLPWEGANTDPNDWIARACYDSNFQLRQDLFSHVNCLLTENGEMYLTYSERANQKNSMEKLCQFYELNCEIVKQESATENDPNNVYYIMKITNLPQLEQNLAPKPK